MSIKYPKENNEMLLLPSSFARFFVFRCKFRYFHPLSIFSYMDNTWTAMLMSVNIACGMAIRK